MAVEVMRTMASRWFRILGSGTVSTRKSFLPCQTLALIRLYLSAGSHPRLFALGLLLAAFLAIAQRLRGLLLFLAETVRAAFGDDHFARFHDLLEAVQVAGHLLAWLLAEKLGHGLAEGAAGRTILDLHAHDRAAPGWAALEAHHARIGHLGVGQRAPGDQLVGAVVGDL